LPVYALWPLPHPRRKSGPDRADAPEDRSPG